jgi:hypothetical protein
VRGVFYGSRLGEVKQKIYSPKKSVFAEHPFVFLPGISEGTFSRIAAGAELTEKYNLPDSPFRPKIGSEFCL